MSNECLPPLQTSDQLTQYRLSMIEKTLQAISESLERLATLEQKHLETREALNRAFTQIDIQDGRLRNIETEMPTLTLVRGWVLAGGIGIIGMLGIAIFKLFTITIH